MAEGLGEKRTPDTLIPFALAWLVSRELLLFAHHRSSLVAPCDAQDEAPSKVSNLQATIQFARSGLSKPGCWVGPTVNFCAEMCWMMTDEDARRRPPLLPCGAADVPPGIRDSKTLKSPPILEAYPDMLEVGVQNGAAGPEDKGAATYPPPPRLRGKLRRMAILVPHEPGNEEPWA